MRRASKRHPKFNIYILLNFLMICLMAWLGLSLSAIYQPPEPTVTQYNDDIPGSPAKVERLSQQIEDAYLRKSSRAMEKILDTWHREYTSNSSSIGNLNDTLRAVYDLYKLIFKPDLTRYSADGEESTAFKYAIIQSQIAFKISTELEVKQLISGSSYLGFLSEPTKHYSIVNNFWPDINLQNAKCLYLSNDYKNALDIFLGKEHPDHVRDNIMVPIRSTDETENRWLFIRDYFYVGRRHWGHSWQYEFPPSIEYIILNDYLDKAVISIRNNYCSGYIVVYCKRNSKWALTYKLCRWIT